MEKALAELEKVKKQNAEMLAEKTERERKQKEAAAKKRKADTERAEALFATVSEMWDKQVTDSLWQDEQSRAEQKKRIEELVQKNPEVTKDLFRIVHCASSRYASVLDSNAARQAELTSKLGHVMKKRKVHAASARHATPETTPAPVAPAEAPTAPRTKSLMDIMKSYQSQGTSGNATNIMQRLYKAHQKRAAPF